MAGKQKIDLLKVSATEQSREIEGQLGEPACEASEALFPKCFAASGVNSGIRFAEIRIPARD